VEAVSAINHVPLNGDDWHFPFAVEGRPVPRPGESPSAEFLVVGPGYFGTMGISILQGRDFTAQDADAAAHFVVINHLMARRHWPGEDPIGKRLSVDDPATHPDWFTVVGVVKDVQQGSWSSPAEEQMYFPYHQAGDSGGGKGLSSALYPVYMTLVLRTSSDPAALNKAVEAVVYSMDRDAAVSSALTMEQAVRQQFAQARFSVFLLGAFAGVALLLAAVGIYGVISYSTARRTHEIGVRVALGAGPHHILRLVLAQGMRLVVLGALAGLVGAYGLTRYVRALLFGVQPTDPLTFVLVVFLLGAVALVACWIPARRALRVEPAIALRHE
jgi:putative ABC transport system permease protein